MKESNLKSMSDLASLCKRRGFIFQSSAIYGGLGSCWDMGPLGVELKNNIKNLWWKAMTYRDDVVGVDAAILMHPTVWKASGHIDNFSDLSLKVPWPLALMRQLRHSPSSVRYDELQNLA